jgi:hypothetical protein
LKKITFILAAIVALVVTAPASANAGLSGWWPMYEGGGTTVHDLSGDHNNGTITGAQWTTGYLGDGLAFNGNGENVDIQDSPLFEPSATLTVTAYVKALGSPGAYKYIVAKGGFGCTTGGYGLYTGPDGGLMFYVDHSDGATYTQSPDYGTSVWDRNWHFVVGTYDGSSVRLYVDGNQVGNGTPDNSPLAYNGPTNADLFIGHYEGCPGLDFTGSIDEPTVWTRALSASNVKFAYNALTLLHKSLGQLSLGQLSSFAGS